MNNKQIEKELEEKGFNEFKPSDIDQYADRCWQKTYTDKDHNKKYFIIVRHYTIIHPTTGDDLGGYEVSSQLYLKDTHKAFNINFLQDVSITEAEDFINFLFESGKLDNYENK